VFCTPTSTGLQRAIKTKTNATARSSSIAIRWLNTQLLRNKIDCIHVAVTDRSLDVLAQPKHGILPATTSVTAWIRRGRRGTIISSWRRGCYHLSQQVEVGIVSTSSLYCWGARRAAASSMLRTSWSCSFIDQARKKLVRCFWWADDRTWDTGRACVSRRHRRRLQRESPAHWWLWCARRMHELLGCFDMVHHVKGPTYSSGNTLDLVISHLLVRWTMLISNPAGLYSYHSLVVCSLPLAVESPSTVERLVRVWRRVNRVAVRRMWTYIVMKLYHFVTQYLYFSPNALLLFIDLLSVSDKRKNKSSLMSFRRQIKLTYLMKY